MSVCNNFLKLRTNNYTKSYILRFYDIPEVTGKLMSYEVGWHSRDIANK
jgi:hypothetical protein